MLKCCQTIGENKMVYPNPQEPEKNNFFQNVAPWLKTAGDVVTSFNPALGIPLKVAGTAMGGFQAEQQKQAELATTAELQKVKDKLIDDYKNNRITSEAYSEAMDQIRKQTAQLDQNKTDYQSDLNAIKGTEVGSSLLNNLIQNATNRQGYQQYMSDALTGEIAATPLQQYRKDADVKRQMALNTQQNLANNVANQLSSLNQGRATNAQLIGNILSKI